MTVDDAIALVDGLLYPDGLNDLQASVFRSCWLGDDYHHIARELGYDPSYIRTIGYRLWRQLGDRLNEKVTKSNLQRVLERYAEKPPKPQIKSQPHAPKFPDFPLNFQSPFYIQRPPIEQHCSQKILQPGSLIRIQAPKYTGKTSLLYYLLGNAREQGFSTLRISFEEATADSFADLNCFLRWLCQSLARKLKLTPNLEQYWNDEASFAKSNCTEYIEDYLLQSIHAPLVLGLDDVERIFTYPHIAQDFFPLLRLWHEEANEIEIWQNLRLIVVHSTEVYVPLDINQSPFNVGLPIHLLDWTPQQVQELALKYNLNWALGNTGLEILRPLLKMVGGHPYLIQLTLYHLWENHLTLENILQNAATDSGIYKTHLRRLLNILKGSPDLCSAMTEVVKSDEPVEIPSMVTYKLQSLGLVKLVGNLVTISYQLYQDYFRSRLDLKQ